MGATKKIFGAFFLVLIYGQSFAVDRFALEAGTGDESADRVGAALQWQWDSRWFESGDWFLGGYTEVSISYWDGDSGRTGNSTLSEVGVTPVFRLQRYNNNNSMTPYFEFGIGAHYMSDSKFGDKDMSTEFQFGDHVGVGFVFGDRQQYDISYRYQHYSNADIETPNPGINFNLLRFGYSFE